MQQTAEFLFAIGGFLLLGLATDFLGRRTSLPRVTLLLILGIIMGDEALGLIPDSVTDRFEIIADMALLMIGFLLGGRLTLKSLRKSGRHLVWISISAALVTTIIVGLALVLIGVPLEIAILLGCIAAATAPAATTDTVLEFGQKTPFSRLLLAIVAVDDAWALILFSLGMASISILHGLQDISIPLLHAIYEIGGAVLLGVVIGLPASYLTGRLKPGQPMLTEALGLVFLCGGAAIWLNVSFLISSIVMGAVIANMTQHHKYPFHEIENIEWPFMVIFFMLAGASLEIGMLAELGLVGAVYLLTRIIGKLLGAWIGAKISDASDDMRHWMGFALMPQAGVAIGMALLAANQFPEYRQSILSIVISTTVFFEIIGPIFTRLALRRTQHS
ncbi:MAG: cation:proton antiporter [Candidatus Sedimenticola sp. (ex Thyasira tokunagai)]